MRVYYSRPVNHFHDPTMPVASAGLSDIFSGSSTIAWATTSPANVWKLNDFYDYLELAFTAETLSDRELNLAGAMKSAGHLVHLLQDMAVPAHTRNDLSRGHAMLIPKEKGVWIGSPLESYLAVNDGLLSGIVPSSVPDFENFQDYFDTRQYYADGSTPVAGSTVGLSEYSHSNFLTDFQHFRDNRLDGKRPYAHPDLTNTEMYDLRLDTWLTYPHLIGRVPPVFFSTYLRKTAAPPAESFEFFGREGFFGKYYPLSNQGTTVFLDERCWQEYISKLVPKAIAYSAGLLEYLFRGDIEFFLDTKAGALSVRNNAGREMDGTFSFYYDDSDGVRSTEPEWRWDLVIPAGQTVTVPDEVSIPRKVGVNGAFTMSFRGRLGESLDVVTGQTRKLTPYDFSFTQGVSYAEIQEPRERESMTAPAPDLEDRNRSYYCDFGFEFFLSNATVYRTTDIRISVAATPALAKMLGYPYEEGGEFPILTNSFAVPALVDYFKVETSPGVWDYAYDSQGIHPDSGWGGTPNPLRYYEGAWQGGSYYVETYRNLGAIQNFTDECSPTFTSATAPGVRLNLSYGKYDSTPVCPNAEEIIEQGRSRCDLYRAFYAYSLSVAREHAPLIFNGEWGNYGFQVRLNQLRITYPRKGIGLILDTPVTFTKRYGSSNLTVY